MASIQPVRFGVFEVDLAAGELRKGGVRIKLREQPFQVLAALLERPGEIVTREELRERLWTDDTFVDFDQGLNGAINKIRDALGDSARSPRFVETLPRRGYRFLAEVRTAADGEEAIAGAGTPESRAGAPGLIIDFHPLAEERGSGVSTVWQTAGESSWKRRLPGALLALSAVVALTVWFRPQTSPKRPSSGR